MNIPGYTVGINNSCKVLLESIGDGDHWKVLVEGRIFGSHNWPTCQYNNMYVHNRNYYRPLPS